MSTVILTPTHMACDHTVMHKCYPHESRVDLGFSKIFSAKQNRFLVGTVGDFNPDQIEKPETEEILGELLVDAIAQQMHSGLVGEMGIFKATSLENQYMEVFDRGGHTFLATRRYRFILRYSNTYKCLTFKRCGDYAGIGSGGMIAVGLLLGGLELRSIWKPLHDMDPLSSAEHSSIPFTSLKAQAKSKVQV